jgi:hypothetical protein
VGVSGAPVVARYSDTAAIDVFAGALKVCTAPRPPVQGGSSCSRASIAPPLDPHVFVAADFGDVVGVKPAAGSGAPFGPAHS